MVYPLKIKRTNQKSVAIGFEYLGAGLAMKVNYQLQDKFLHEFFTTAFARDFYLTGGTALARFYFHHRVSVDLDLFTNNQKIDFDAVNAAIRRIMAKLKLKPDKAVVTDTFIQYIIDSPRPLKVDLVKDIPVHFGENLIKGRIAVDSLINLATNKILAIFGRIDPKDFIDLFFILEKTKFEFDELFTLAKQKDLGLTELYFSFSIDKFLQTKILPPILVSFNKRRFYKFYQDLR